MAPAKVEMGRFFAQKARFSHSKNSSFLQNELC
jgi:hypothetical protein